MNLRKIFCVRIQSQDNVCTPIETMTNGCDAIKDIYLVGIFIIMNIGKEIVFNLGEL